VVDLSLGDDRNPSCHPEGGGLFETSLFRDRFAEFIERFEVERQGLFSMLDGLFVGFPPRIVAFERRKIGQIVVGVFLDRETIRSSILFPNVAQDYLGPVAF
jgi:hypothetical protein